LKGVGALFLQSDFEFFAIRLIIVPLFLALKILSIPFEEKYRHALLTR
jgi:hypothetical protein